MQNNPYMLAYMGFFLYLCRRFYFVQIKQARLNTSF